MIRLPPASRALINFPDAILGLTPQALRWRPLRGLSQARATRRECLYKTSGCDRAGTFVLHDNDATRTDNAFRHLEGRRDRAIRKQPFPLAQSYRIDHQPEIIDQIMLHKRLE